MKKPNTVRITVELSPSMYKLLVDVQGKMDHITKSQVLRRGLMLLQLATTENVKVQIVNRLGETIEVKLL